MGEKQIETWIGGLAVVIVAYHIVSYFVEYLVWVVIGLVVLRVFQEYIKSKR